MDHMVATLDKDGAGTTESGEGGPSWARGTLLKMVPPRKPEMLKMPKGEKIEVVD